MKIEDDDLIKAWISRDVEPLTDAEPGALAKYVIALIKKPLSDDELEKLCLEKLEVFLQSHTKSFVERLFRCLKGGLYLPEASQPTNDSPSNEFDDGDDFVLTDGGGSDVEDDEETQSKPTSNSEKKAQPSSSSDKLKSRVVAPEARKQESSSSKPSANTTAAARPQRRRISPPASSSSSKPMGSKEEGDKEAGTTSAPFRSHPANRRPSPPARGGRGRMGAGSRDARPSGRSERYHRRQRSWSRSRSRSRSPHRKEKREEHEPSRRHRCRDFHEKGFCMRGDKCMYDHGPDPVVIENSALEKIVGRNPAGAVPSSTTSASSAAVGAAVYNPMNPPPPGIDNKVVYGASPTTEPYNPEAPGLNAPPTAVSKMDFSVPPPPIHHPSMHYAGPPPPIQPPPYTTQPINVAPATGLVTVIGGPATSFNPQPAGHLLGMPQDPMANAGPGFYNNQQMGGGTFRRGMRGGGRYRPYGGNMGTRINPALCSLLVKKIPPEQNKIVMLDQHFGKFGQITNLHVQFEGQPDTALVTFKTRREAMNAYKSTEPIFNNRFIKVFWQTQPDLPAGGATDNQDAAADPSATGDAEKAGAQPLPTDLNRNFSKTFGSDQAASALQPVAESKPNAEHSTYDPSGPQQAIPLSSGNGAAVTGTHLKRPVYNPRALAAKRRAEKESLMKLLELHRLKTELYTKLFEQQKDLLQKIQATENKEIRKKYMTLVKSTSTSMAGAKTEIEKLGEQIKDLQKKQQEAAKKPAFGASFPRGAANNNGYEQRKSSAAGQEEGNENVKTASIPSSPLPPNSSTNKKLFKVVHVSGCPVQSNEDLIVHMESFGELFDFDIAPRNRASPCVFTYKNPADAQRAVAEASNFPQADKLKVEWAPVSLGQHTKVVPDKERKPNEQMTPAALLAALENDDDYDSDNEDDHQNGKNEEEDLELEL